MAGTRSLGSLTLDLIARVGGFTRGLDQAEREAQRRVRGIQNTFRGLSRVVSGALAAIGGAAVVRAIVRSTSEAEAAFANLRNAVEQNGGAVGRTTDQLATMASELQKVSTFGDETIMTAQGLLLRFQSIQGVNFDRAVQSTLDLASALGRDLTSSARLIGKALEIPRKGLTQLEEAGVVLDKSQADLVKRLVDTGRHAEAQQVLLDGLEKRFSGAARAARDTFGGALTAVQNAFGDLLEAKGGLNEATSALNEFADLLQDPDTVAAANTLASAIVTAFSKATEAITGTVNVVKFLGEELAARVSGAALDDIVRMENELEKIDDILSSSTATNWIDRFDIIGQQGWFSWWSEDELRARRDQLTKAIEDAYSNARPVVPVVEGADGQGPTIPPPPTEEFLKLQATLEQQIALFGKVGEAAKIAYQIESGQLDDLSESEQQRILRLARQYDLLVENAAAEKELEAARKQLDSALKSQIANYEQQIALTGEVTELERIRYEIAKGGLQGITADQAAYLESLAKEIDLEKQRSDLQSRISSLVEEHMTPLERYNKTIEDLNKLREESIEVLGDEGLAYETYARAVEKAQKDLEEATHQTNEFLLEAARNTQNILADTLFDGMQGKIDDIGESFKKMIDRMVANALAAKLATALFGDPENPGGGGGWFGTAVSWLGSLFGGGRASGGSTASGMLYRVNERGVEGLSVPGLGDYLLMGNRSGQVIPTERAGRSSTVNQTFMVQGRVDQRSASQLAIEAARRARIATARLG